MGVTGGGSGRVTGEETGALALSVAGRGWGATTGAAGVPAGGLLTAGAGTGTVEFIVEPGLPLVELFVHAGLCPSKGQARKDLEGGGLYLNNIRVTEVARSATSADLLFGKHLLLRKGKRNYLVVTAR